MKCDIQRRINPPNSPSSGTAVIAKNESVVSSEQDEGHEEVCPALSILNSFQSYIK